MRAHKIYQNNSVSMMHPIELSIKLLKSALKHMEQANRSGTDHEIPEMKSSVRQAQQILLEVITLIDVGHESGKKLTMLLEFYNRQLMTVYLENDLHILEEIEGYIRQIQRECESTLKNYRKRNFDNQFA